LEYSFLLSSVIGSGIRSGSAVNCKYISSCSAYLAIFSPRRIFTFTIFWLGSFLYRTHIQRLDAKLSNHDFYTLKRKLDDFTAKSNGEKQFK